MSSPIKYNTHACLHELQPNCTGSDNVQTATYQKTLDEIKTTFSKTKPGTYAYSYAMSDYYNAIKQSQLHTNSYINSLGDVSGDMRTTDAQYEYTMIAGVMWATLGTVMLYFTFTGLNQQ